MKDAQATAPSGKKDPPSVPPEPVPGDIDLAKPELYLNRELSLIEFNRRVLAQALDPGVPLLERLRFLTIFSTNIDEFFEVRVAGLKQQASFGVGSTHADAMAPVDVLRRISQLMHGLVDEQYRCLNEKILPELEGQGVVILKRPLWSADQREWLGRYFDEEILPVLTPMGLDPAHPFPRVLNKGLSLIVRLEGRDAFGRASGLAVLQVPRCLPRLIQLPTDLCEPGVQVFVLLTSLIHKYVSDLFPGMKMTGCYQFRVTRNSDLWVDEEAVDNLLHALQGELPGRRFGDAVRLEVADNCEPELATFLLNQFGLGEVDLYTVKGPVNLHRLVGLIDLVERPALQYPAFVPSTSAGLGPSGSNVMDRVRQRDILLHHPYEAFSPIVELVRQAAEDPEVLAIKQTMYRTTADSPLVGALIEAARSGKEVTAVVELRARFDEAENIDLANRLQSAGANVVYGVVGYKTHAKMLLIVRREPGGIRRYVHLGTGNYHPFTTRVYTDLGLLTCDKKFGEDVHKVFMSLTGFGKRVKMKRVLQAPFALHKTLVELIEAEAEEARAGREARIIARMNALSERAIIQALYRASRAGVPIDLIVRGVCCLRPGLPGISEGIRVRSIVGRFLEHSRVFYFHAAGRRTTYLASADWMSRNLHRRVETCFPVEDPKLKQRVLDEALLTYLDDNTQSWMLQPDGRYLRLTPGEGEPPRAAQMVLLDRLTE